MKELEDLLGKAKLIMKEEDAQSIFDEISNGLFNNFCFKTGNIEFRFLEIEFYYYSQCHKDLVYNEKNEPKPFVYPRSCTKDGQFLLHASGLDICFKGTLVDKENGEGGGILVRSLLMIEEGKKDKLVAGPWDCYSTLFSYTDNDNHLQLELLPEDARNKAKVTSFTRKIGEPKLKDDKSGYTKTYTMANKPYAFYDARYVKDDKFMQNDKPIERYDYQIPGNKKKSQYYLHIEKRNKDNATLQRNK